MSDLQMIDTKDIIPGTNDRHIFDMDKLYNTKEAAHELGITVAGLWYHIQAGNITPTKVGKTLIFTRAQLDEFQANRKPAGRPKMEDK
jgi:hypothetical protein